MAESTHWEKNKDVEFKKYQILNNYLKNLSTAAFVTAGVVSTEFIGTEGFERRPTHQTIYHYMDSTLSLEKIEPSQTRLNVFSPTKDKAQEVLDEILRETNIKPAIPAINRSSQSHFQLGEIF